MNGRVTGSGWCWKWKQSLRELGKKECLISSPLFRGAFKGLRAAPGAYIINWWVGRGAGSSSRILKRLLEELSWQQSPSGARSDSITEHNCLFWRAGSYSAGGTGFAAIRQRKAGKIPQTEIVSACGQAGSPNLDSGIWWENAKRIRGYRASPRFITMASGYFQKNQQVMMMFPWVRRRRGPSAYCNQRIKKILG